MSTLRIDTLAERDGSESVPVDTVIHGSAKAWVNFNGTGTVSKNASFNVGTVTDNGVGDYTINFDTPMPDTNYATAGMGNNAPSQHVVAENGLRTVSAFRISVQQPGVSAGDSPSVSVAVFR